MDHRTANRTARRLVAAEGYLELGMPEHALAELDTIEDVGDFQVAFHLLKGNALRSQQRFHEAVDSFQHVVQLVEPEHSREAWLTLGACLRESGQEDHAAAAELIAEKDDIATEREIPPTQRIERVLRSETGPDETSDEEDAGE